MDKVLEWGNLNGLSFNPKKTQMVLFTNKRRWQPPKVKMGDMALELREVSWGRDTQEPELEKARHK